MCIPRLDICYRHTVVDCECVGVDSPADRYGEYIATRKEYFWLTCFWECSSTMIPTQRETDGYRNVIEMY